MKRFLADALLVLVLVCAGSYLQHEEGALSLSDLEEKVDHFEKDVAMQRILQEKERQNEAKQHEDNNASRAAKGTSELITHTLEGTTKMFSSLFDSLLESVEE